MIFEKGWSVRDGDESCEEKEDVEHVSRESDVKPSTEAILTHSKFLCSRVERSFNVG